MGVPLAFVRVGHMEEIQAHYEAIGRAGGAKFWFHGLRNCFISLAE